MATRIYKYPIEIADSLEVPMQKGARLLCVQVQSGEVCLWAMVNEHAPLVPRRLAVRGTGHNCDGLEEKVYVGTFQLAHGAFVGHLFDLGE